ncbi:hypothetical protein GCM10009731_66760 [Streptomyces globosus]
MRRAGRGPVAEQGAAPGGLGASVGFSAPDGGKSLSRVCPRSGLGRLCLRMTLWTSFPDVTALPGSRPTDLLMLVGLDTAAGAGEKAP